jgi:hypothetical protein
MEATNQLSEKKFKLLLTILVRTPYCIMFSCWQSRVSTTLQKMNANILYLATCKIAREQHHGPGFVHYHRVRNEEQNFHRGN